MTGFIDPFWRGKRVFITGHTGFKGAWLTLWLARQGASVRGYALAPDSSPSLFNILNLEHDCDSRIEDIRDKDTLCRSINEFKPDILFHLAAESLVPRAFLRPDETFDINVGGTVNILDACRNVNGIGAVVVVTSDKCYAMPKDGSPRCESDALGGDEPYSASKACAELVAGAFRKTYFSSPGMPGIASVRAGNVIGGGDWSAQRLIPDMVRAIAQDKPVILRSPDGVRPWQHVIDCLSGYLLLAKKLYEEPEKYSKAWNFGPQGEENLTAKDVASLFYAAMGKTFQWEQAGVSGLVETPVLRLDSRRAETGLGWRAGCTQAEAIALAAEWYARQANRGVNDMRDFSLGQIESISARTSR